MLSFSIPKSLTANSTTTKSGLDAITVFKRARPKVEVDAPIPKFNCSAFSNPNSFFTKSTNSEVYDLSKEEHPAPSVIDPPIKAIFSLCSSRLWNLVLRRLIGDRANSLSSLI